MSETYAIIATAVLFVGGVVVLGFGATQWSRAISAAVQARAHGNEAAAQEATMRYAADALEETPPEPRPAPTRISDAELRRTQQWMRDVATAGEEASADDRPYDSRFEGGLFAEDPDTK